MSFADGFTKGFGLVSDAFNDKRAAELREQDLGLRRQMQAEDRKFRQDQITQQAKDRAQAREDRAEERRLAAEDRRLTAEYRIKSLAAQRGDAAAQQNIDRLRAENQNLELQLKQQGLDATKEAREKDKRTEDQAFAAQDLYVLNEAIDAGTLDIEDPAVQKRFNDAYAVLKGTNLDPANSGDPTEFIKAENFGRELQNLRAGRPVVEEHFLAAFNQLVDKATKKGAVIDETAIYAPKRYQDGNWKIVDRKAVSMQRASNEGLFFYGRSRSHDRRR